MNAVLVGFATLAAVIALGWVVGRTGVLGAGASGVLSRLAFFVATPALLFLTLAEADTSLLVSPALLATAGSAALCALLFVVLARWRWRWRLPAADLATGALASSYVNAGNLGVAISVYVLGDASFVAPVLLFQVLVMAPIGLAFLAGRDIAESRVRVLTAPVRTPVVLGCGLGLLVAVTGLRLPEAVLDPVELTAALAVPAALLSYGMSLHGAPPPGTGRTAGQVWLAVVLTTLVQPGLAYALGRWVAGLDGPALLAVTVVTALPTAQNVFVYASAYRRDTVVARDAILLSTVLSVPVLIGVAFVLA